MKLSRPRRSAASVAVAALTAVTMLGACSKDESTAPPPEPTPSVTPTTTPTPTPTPTPKPKPVDPLTGGKVSKNGVYAVKIDNVQGSHPQFGISKADQVVVEEVEGNQTRYIAVFHSTLPKQVGPVRSARNSDLMFLPVYGKPGLVYSGANSKVQRQVNKASVVPIERSDREPSRTAPHNVVVNLDALSKKHKVGTTKEMGFTFKQKDSRWSKAGKAASPDVRIGHDTFEFDYTKGRYKVSWNGQVNTDQTSGKQTRADNVVVLAVKNIKDKNTTSNQSKVSKTVGKGKATFYRDGRKMSGQWSRSKLSAPMKLTDSAGKDVPLKPGRSWILLQG